jgi:hypothetical protein
MYSPSDKHAPHNELSLKSDTTLVGAEDGEDTTSSPTPTPPTPMPPPPTPPQKGSLYACSTIFDASVMYHAVVK